MRILITGSRTWTDRATIARQLATWGEEGTTVVSGACPTGADHMAEQEAVRLGYELELHPADWSKGRGAGFARNQEMVNLGADVVLAFWDGNSRGTKHTIDRARAKGLEVLIVRSQEGRQ